MTTTGFGSSRSNIGNWGRARSWQLAFAGRHLLEIFGIFLAAYFYASLMNFEWIDWWSKQQIRL